MQVSRLRTLLVTCLVYRSTYKTDNFRKAVNLKYDFICLVLFLMRFQFPYLFLFLVPSSRNLFRLIRSSSKQANRCQQNENKDRMQLPAKEEVDCCNLSLDLVCLRTLAPLDELQPGHECRHFVTCCYDNGQDGAHK